MRDDQLLVDVWLSRPDEQDSFQPQKQTALRGLLDTGAQITGLSEEAIKDANLVPFGVRDMRGPHGVATDTPIFAAYLGLVFSNRRRSVPEFLHTRIEPVQTRRISEKFDILVGMDVLKNYRLCIANGEFELTAPAPLINPRG